MSYYDYQGISFEKELSPYTNFGYRDKRYKYYNKSTDQLKELYMWAKRKARHHTYFVDRGSIYSENVRKQNETWRELFQIKAAGYAEEIKRRADARKRSTIRDIAWGNRMKKWLYEFHNRPVKYKKLNNRYDRNMYHRYLFLYRNNYIRWDPILNYKFK